MCGTLQDATGVCGHTWTGIPSSAGCSGEGGTSESLSGSAWSTDGFRGSSLSSLGVSFTLDDDPTSCSAEHASRSRGSSVGETGGEQLHILRYASSCSRSSYT